MKALLHLIYPAGCIHCKELLLSHQKVLCPSCTELVALIDIDDRCIKCFKQCQSFSKICKSCHSNPPFFSKLALCFDSIGPAASLINEFPNRLFLDEQLAPWMVVQMDRMNFPKSDLIIPFPQNINDKFLEGYNRARLLALKVGSLYEVAVNDCLGQTQDARFYWKRSIPISDQIVLLVVEKIESMAAISRCAEVINAGFPKAVYVIALGAYQSEN